MVTPARARSASTIEGASGQRLQMLEQQRRELRTVFVRRFWLRWHMALMLAATFGAGFLANRLLLHVPVHEMAVRWVLVLAVSYGAFFVCIRIWLAYVGARPIIGGDVGDALSTLDPGSAGGAQGGCYSGGGGRFGGGGATSAWGDSPIRALGNLSGGDLDAGDGDGCLLAVLGALVLALLATIAGGVVVLVVAAPAMLVDTAFSALLAGGLVKHVRRMDEPDWEGSVIRSTWKPFAGVAALALVTGIVAHYAAPGARTLGEVMMLFN
jgi:hypothetical protein